MKIFGTSIFLTAIILIIACQSQKNHQSKSQQGIMKKIQVSYTEDYCGGAFPSDNILKAEKKVKAYTNKELILSKEGWPAEKMITYRTSSEGQFDMDLSPGSYQLFMPEKISATYREGSVMSREVCEKWKSTPNGILLIKEDTSGTLEVTIHRSCNRCIERAR